MTDMQPESTETTKMTDDNNVNQMKGDEMMETNKHYC
jgi:hypothetical protein